MEDEPQFQQRLDKLTEAVVYLVWGSRSDPNFGEPKLVKLLYYADCAAYRRFGAPMTGTTYLHYPHGPYPSDWYKSKRAMQAAGDVQVRQEDVIGVHRVYRQHRWIAKRSARSEVLSAAERAILDEQLLRFADFNAAGMEEYSHQELGWLSTEDGEPIPYCMAGLSDAPLSDDELCEAERIAADVARKRTAV
ncbi:MAG: Panacea domain-containing protein [Chloroflexota bacterium]|nr:Panacea domain-containing protein [Chloroflexota bacterium]MDE2958604.1 Panacea domain-containing protein [Chloroflexota bacterium]